MLDFELKNFQFGKTSKFSILLFQILTIWQIFVSTCWIWLSHQRLFC